MVGLCGKKIGGTTQSSRIPADEVESEGSKAISQSTPLLKYQAWLNKNDCSLLDQTSKELKMKWNWEVEDAIWKGKRCRFEQ